MKVKTFKTKKIVAGDDLYKILNKYLPKKIEERSVVAVTSKIVSICEGRIVKRISSDYERDELVKKEADLYLPRSYSQWNYMVAVKDSVLSGSAGIDMSNGNGNFILWPKNTQTSANKIRSFLIEKYKVEQLGVIITDSRSAPLRWGAIGISIAHTGFKALKNYIGTRDLFGRIMQAERANIADALAVAAVVEMGEGNEQTPLAIISDVNFVDFQKRNPTKKELDFLKLTIENDFFSYILTKTDWLKGGK